MDLIKIENKSISLNSNLTESAFGKTQFGILSQYQGIVATSKGGLDSSEFNFSFEPWTFQEVKSFETGYEEPVAFFNGSCDSLFENTQTLLKYFAAQDSVEKFEGVFAAISAILQAIQKNIDLPYVGAGGIIISTNKEETSVIFLPALLFKTSVFSLPADDYAFEHNLWVNETLSGKEALKFEAASLTYSLLTNHFPYPATDITERNADLLDKKYVPLKVLLQKIDSIVTEKIDLCLTAPSKAEDFPLAQLYTLKNSYKEFIPSDTDYEEKEYEYLKNRIKAINAKRKLRRNVGTLIGIGIGIIGAIIVVISMIDAHNEQYSSKGLTSTQTVECFFTGINDLNTGMLESITKGSHAKSFVNVVSQIYVSSTQRQTYAFDYGYCDPAEWAAYVQSPEDLKKAGVYGVTNVLIDGKKANLQQRTFRNKDKIKPLRKENDEVLHDGITKQFFATYYVVHSEGEFQEIFVNKVESTITVTYKGTKWIITDISVNNTPVELDYNKFIDDYFMSLEKHEGNVKEAVNELKASYIWLPDSELIPEL
ncbi:MAG: hypothetical protein MR420_02310 [Spirochaetia bacterium]|nr:hypothetical protein [Spirochaetia bacterium]